MKAYSSVTRFVLREPYATKQFKTFQNLSFYQPKIRQLL